MLDRNHMLIMADPVRHFPYLESLSHPVPEVLLVPFHLGAEAVVRCGLRLTSTTATSTARTPRLVTSLSQFAAAAVQVMASAETNRKLEEAARVAAEREVQRLAEENQRITALDRRARKRRSGHSARAQGHTVVARWAARLIGRMKSSALFDEILAAAMTITEADAGTIQLLDGATQTLAS